MINKLKNKYTESLKDKNFFEILTGSAMALVVKIFTVIFGLISNLIIAKYYGSEVLGTISVLFSIMGIASIFSLLGMDVSILRFIPPLIKQKKYYEIYITIIKVLLLVSFFSLIIALCVYSFSDFIAINIFHKNDLTSFIVLISFFIFPQALGNISRSVIRAFQNIKIFLLLQFLPSLLNLLLLLILTFLFYSKYNPLYSQLSTQLFVMLISFIFLYKLVKNYKTSRTNHNISNKELLATSLPMFLTAVMQLVVLQTDVLMLGSMSTLESVGIYSIVMKLALLSSFVIGSINTIIAPKFSELYYNDELDELKSVARKSTKLIFYSTLPITLILIIFGVYLLSIFGNDFTAGYYALIMLAIGQLINSMAGSVGYLLNMTGYQKVFNKIVLCGAVSNVILNILLIPKYGINGAAFASMLSIIFWNITASIYSKKYLGFYIFYVPKLQRN